MTAEEIKQIVADLRAQGTDTLRVEAKAAKRAVPKTLYDTLSAFSNTNGGLVLLGVDENDDFGISGVQDASKVATDASSQCSDMEPALYPEISIVDVDGAQVVVIELDALARRQRPCYRKASGIEKGTYLRRHDGDVRATWPQIQAMISEQTQPQEDLRPVAEASLADLDDELMDGLYERVRRRRGFRRMNREQALRQLNAIAEDENGNLVPTVAGLFALGRYPQQYLGRVGIEYAIRPTEEEAASGIRLLRSQTFEGPVPHMVDDALATLATDVSGAVIIKDAQKETRLQYPRDALREAIVNSLVHRNLRRDAGEATTIDIYPDRLVVRNPGGLFDLREDELADFERKPRSVARNGALLKLLEDVPSESRETVVEARATGIRTMLREMRAAGMAPPRFHDEVTVFTVEFPKHTLLDPETIAWLNLLPLDDVVDEQRIALAMARRGDQLDNPSYRQATGIGDSRVATRHLTQLTERELLMMHGTRRWATYSLGEAADVPTDTPPRGGVNGGVLGHDPVFEPVNEPVNKRRRTIEEASRRAWVLGHLAAGHDLRRPDVQAGLGVSQATAKRLLDGMRRDGLIWFEGAPKTGSYRRAVREDTEPSS